MDLLSRTEFHNLAEIQNEGCVSIYLPTHRAGPETQQDQIRLKNLLSEAEQHLSALNISRSTIESALAPAHDLESDPLFWRYQSDGLTLFLSAKEFRYYRLPLTFAETVIVTTRFHLKPLFPIFFSGGRFFLLALSQNDVQLFECTQHQIDKVSLLDMPTSLAEALKYDDPERQLQFHTGASDGKGRRPAMFHGQGVGIDDNKDRILRFFQLLDKGLHEILRDEHSPLVLAGVDYLLPIYHKANSYRFLVNNGVTGNPESSHVTDLHQQAWAIVQPLFQQEQAEAHDRYRSLRGTERASSTLKTIIPAAYQGRVDILFVAVGIQQWGTFHPDDHTVALHNEAGPGHEDLLDFSALHTFINGGVVYATPPEQIPADAPLAAVFRY